MHAHCAIEHIEAPFTKKITKSCFTYYAYYSVYYLSLVRYSNTTWGRGGGVHSLFWNNSQLNWVTCMKLYVSAMRATTDQLIYSPTLCACVARSLIDSPNQPLGGSEERAKADATRRCSGDEIYNVLTGGFKAYYSNSASNTNFEHAHTKLTTCSTCTSNHKQQATKMHTAVICAY